MGKDFCKDCKHCKIDYTDDPTDESAPYLKFEDCPISDWFEHVWSVQESGLYEYGGYICDFDTLRPPSNCNCFEPKEEINCGDEVGFINCAPHELIKIGERQVKNEKN